MALPDWAPDLDEVADYITSRTVDLDVPGSDAPIGTFSSSTYPTSDQVDRLIASACAWVTNVTGLILPPLVGSAKDVAAMRTAALVELSYPVRNNDIDAATAMLAQAKDARDELADANRAAGEPGPSPTAAPVFAFPDPQRWTGNEPSRLSWRTRSPDVW